MTIVRTKKLDPDNPGRLIAKKRRLTSKHAKAALYAYFRFERTWLCADEVSTRFGRADLVADNGKFVVEVEVKMTKHDLWGGEAKKWHKHQAENKLSAPCPNKFYVCVPMGLESEAVKWCEAVDPRYGVMVFVGWKFLSENPASSSIFTLRVAQDLHSEYKSMRDKIAMRLCSAAACQKMREARASQ